MAGLNINELATTDISLTDFIVKADENGLATKNTIQNLANLLATAGNLSFKGSLLIADAISEDGWYFANESGTFANANNLVITLDNNIAIIIKEGSNYDLVNIPIVTSQTDLSFNNLSDATSYWNTQDTAGQTPSENVEFYLKDLNQFWKWNSALTEKSEFSREDKDDLERDNWLNKDIPIAHSSSNNDFVRQGIDAVIGLNVKVSSSLQSNDFIFEILCADSSGNSGLAPYAYSLVIKDNTTNTRYPLDGVKEEDKNGISFLYTKFSEDIEITAVIDWYSLPATYAMFGQARARVLVNQPNLLLRRFEQINNRFNNLEDKQLWLNKEIPIAYTESNNDFVQQGLDAVLDISLNVPSSLENNQFQFEIFCADSSANSSLAGFAYSLVLKDRDANVRYKLDGVKDYEKTGISVLIKKFDNDLEIIAIIDWSKIPTTYAMFGESSARVLSNLGNTDVEIQKYVENRLERIERNDDWINKELPIAHSSSNFDFVKQGLDAIVNLELIVPSFLNQNDFIFEILCADSSENSGLAPYAYSLVLKDNVTNTRYQTSVAIDVEKGNKSLLFGIFKDGVEIYATVDWSKLPTDYAMFGESATRVLYNISSPDKSLTKEVFKLKPYQKEVLWVGTSIPEGSMYPKESCRRNSYKLHNRALGSSGIVISDSNFTQIGGRAGKDLTETVAEKVARYTNDAEIDKIIINSSATSNGTITYVLDGVSYSANVLSGDSANVVAGKIRAVGVTNWTVTGSNNEVVFTHDSTGIRAYPTSTNNAGVDITITPIQLGTYFSQEDLDNIYSWSYENRLIPYIDGTIAKCDVLVFDHGHNDRNFINNEVDNLDNLDWTLKDTGVDRTTWNGAFRYLMTKILKVNPQIKIVIAGHFEGYSDSPDVNNLFIQKSGKALATMHTFLAENYGFKLIETWKHSNCGVHYVPGTSNYISDFNSKYNTNHQPIEPDADGNITSYQICCPDGVHPHTDRTNKFNETLSNTFTEGLKSL